MPHLYMASALDQRFEELPFLKEENRQEVYYNMAMEASPISLARNPNNEPEQKNEETDLSPPCKRKNVDSSCALEDLFGNAFYPPKRQHLPLSLYNQAEDEVKKYKETEPLPLSGDPLIWWKEHQSAFPLLSNFARYTLCIPGSSVAAERVFSMAADIITATHYSDLNPEHVDQLLFLNKNLKMP
ncbi:E3 SUMO-protein ligase ZBED1-like [Myxocyprinus asiaticus]|uniref:E3 SUMO-protein ligase ZBED1-like n=1 Tax=Myxocyprinus asiaticus TaxID=70543 RepID=UPI002222A9E0|nr:E3 SUMO-protein ligase ZBED1-like [Myxocyprinus asiaticus]